MLDTMTASDAIPAGEMRLLTDGELDEVNGGLIWLAAALVGFAVGAAAGAVMRAM